MSRIPLGSLSPILWRSSGRHARRRSTGAGRLVVTVVVAVMMAAGSAALGLPAQAATEASGVVLMNGQGLLANRFGSSEIVFAAGTAVGGNGLIPAVDLYVMPNADWADRDGTDLVDWSNPSHVPNTAVGFEFTDLPIWLPYLWPGGWDVVVDKNQDGKFEAARDDVIGSGKDPGFTVYFDGNTTAFDKDALKRSFAAPWMRAAQYAETMTSMVAAFQAVNTVTGTYAWVQAAATLNWGEPAVGALKCLVAECTTVKSAAYIDKDHVEAISTLWNSSPPGLSSPAKICNDALHLHYPDQPLTCNIPSDPTSALSSEDFGTEQLQLASANLEKTVAGIYADPPDPHYAQIWQAPTAQTTFTAAQPQSPAPEQASLANLINAAAVDAEGLLHALERFDGAVAAGDDTWSRRQAGEAHDRAQALAEDLGQVRQQSTATARAMRTAGIPLGLDDRTAFGALQTRLGGGFSQAEIDDLKTGGWTDADIENLRHRIIDVPVADLPADTATILDSFAAITDDATAALWSFAGDAAGIAGAPATPKPPKAGFVATADPTNPATVSVDATGSVDPDGTIVTYTWDFGDGHTANGPVLNHTYTASGSYTVTLTVTDDTGLTGTTKQSVTVQLPVNSPPIARFTANPTSGTVPLPVTLDATASTDSDGTITSYNWDFGDGSSGTGAKVVHEYAVAGSFTVILSVTDDQGAAGSAKTVVTPKGNAAPTTQNDRLTAERTGVVDVLGNDADPERHGLTVTGTTPPSHGTAHCGPLGGCLYTADAGYVGTDSFTYQVRDGDGNTAGATVTVTVVQPTIATDVPLARNDTLVTTVDTPATIDVLANDAGRTPMHVTAVTTPSRGTTSCTDAGACTYRPASGFVGDDGFRYTVADAAGATATGSVQVSVASAASYGISVTGTAANGSGTSVDQGQDAAWTVAAHAAAGTSVEQAAATPRPNGSVTLDGPQTVSTSSVKLAPGWTSAITGTGLTFNAGEKAVLGDNLTTLFPRPLPPISQGTGGDGHVPILVGSKVFAFFHHSSPTSVTCVDRSTGLRCPGYPKQVPFATTDINGPGAVVGSRIYVHLINRDATTSSPVAVFCWDAATDATCGLTVVDRVDGSAAPAASAPVLVAGKAYLAGQSGTLYCIDPAADGSPCTTAGIQSGLKSVTGGFYDVVTHGSRVFIGSSTDGAVACVDVTAGRICDGWQTPRPLGGWNVVNEHDGTGAAVGVCGVSGSSATCLTDGSETTHSYANWPANDGYYGNTLEAETGTRTFVASLNRGGLGCFDWTTHAPCSGTRFSADGWVGLDVAGSGLPSAYGAVWDGTCAVALGDPGKVFTVDAAGASPCTSLGSGTALPSVDLRSQRCDATVGQAKWRSVRLVDATSGELASVNAEVRDADSQEVLGRYDLAPSGFADLSGIDAVAHPRLSISAVVTSAGGSAPWDDDVPPRVQLSWNPDPQQVCFRATTVVDCSQPDQVPISTTARLAGTAATASAQLTVRRSASCPPTQNRPPTVAIAPVPAQPEGSAFRLSATAADPDNDPLTVHWTVSPGPDVDAGSTCAPADADAVRTTAACTDDGTWTFTATVTDRSGASTSASMPVVITNAAPTAAVTAPADMTVVGVKDAVSVATTVSDPGTNDTHTCSISWGDGTSPGTAAVVDHRCTLSHAWKSAGTYEVTVTVRDDDGGQTVIVRTVVSTPATRTSGGGYLLLPDRVSFGFEVQGPASGSMVVRDHNNASFHVTAVATVTAAGKTVNWSGTGRWNDIKGCTFTASATDNRAEGARHGQPDTFTIHVRGPGGAVLLSASGPLAGGNITVHK